MPRRPSDGTGPRSGRQPGSRYRAPGWPRAPRSRWLSPGYCERSSAPAVWSRGTSPGSGNRHATARRSRPARWRSRPCFPQKHPDFGWTLARPGLHVRDVHPPGSAAMPAETFRFDRLTTPIGVALLVTDDAGVLRALDWEDYEVRMRQLLRLQCG